MKTKRAWTIRILDRACTWTKQKLKSSLKNLAFALRLQIHQLKSSDRSSGSGQSLVKSKSDFCSSRVWKRSLATGFYIYSFTSPFFAFHFTRRQSIKSYLAFHLVKTHIQEGVFHAIFAVRLGNTLQSVCHFAMCPHVTRARYRDEEATLPLTSAIPVLPTSRGTFTYLLDVDGRFRS